MLPEPKDAQHVRLQFIQDLNLYETEKPYYMVQGEEDGLPAAAKTNIVLETRSDVPVHDIRGRESSLSLEDDGFMYFEHGTQIGTRFDEDSMSEDIKEMVAWIQKHMGAERAICYDYRLRSNSPSTINVELEDDRSVPVLPILLAHTDHTREGGLRRIGKHLTKLEKTKFLSGQYRCRIINLWKPLIDHIEDNPLTICDPISVSESDLLAVDRVSRTWVGEIYYPKYNSNQHWWYLSNQRKNEVCAFLTFDSHPGSNKINYCAHASFLNPSADPNAEPRKSIELRVIVFNRL